MNDNLKHFLEYFKYLDNPISALKLKFGLKNKVIIKVKNFNEPFELSNVAALNRLMHYIPVVSNKKLSDLIDYVKELNKDEKIIEINNVKYLNVHNTEFLNEYPMGCHVFYEEYFSDDQWDMTDLDNRHVIDIGANVADSTLFFAKENADVIGFEPVKHLFDVGNKNISLNPDLENRITFVNKAVGGKSGKININMASTEEYIDSNESYEVECITINEILNNFDFEPDILKIDCEGCEFEIIPNSDLSMFNDIMFEHHSQLANNDYNILIDKLEQQGFKVKKYSCRNCRGNFEEIGIIHAFK